MCSFDSRNAFLILSGSGQKWHLNVLDLVSKARERGWALVKRGLGLWGDKTAANSNAKVPEGLLCQLNEGTKNQKCL